MKLLKDEGKTTREHAEVLDEVLEEGQWNVAQGIDTLNGHDLERTKKMFGTAYFVAKVEPLIVKYGQILLLEEGRVWMLGMPIRIQIQESLLTILVILTGELNCRLAKIIFTVFWQTDHRFCPFWEQICFCGLF